ncbi:hypothetical protein [Frankia sp. Cj5]|uniref:hypothetical protein n=1 Tax=Frankia sp. Cj5 TaxID=2880978 RepID=UPI001EF53383|nr:hypothetical protein [Frankia sp. Cj5]
MTYRNFLATALLIGGLLGSVMLPPASPPPTEITPAIYVLPAAKRPSPMTIQPFRP